jgi:hypothetical protein
MYRVKKINIDVPRDIIIVEKFDREIGCIVKGSRLFCGCCGYIMGSCIIDVPFPVDSVYLSRCIGNKTFYINRFGMFHSVCRNILFPHGRTFSFIEVDRYFKEVYKQKIIKGIGLN